MLEYPFFQNALLGVSIISVAAAIIGTYIVTRRMVFISGGITHTCFGGLGLGYYLGVSPLAMAALFAIGGAVGVDALSRSRVRQDTAIAVVWAVGMALGILFIFLTPGYVPELNTFLFGNVLTVTPADLAVFGVFALILLTVFLLFGRTIVAVSFDEDFARIKRLPVRFVNLMMTVLTAVCIVLTIRMIGVMLLMSMMSLPQMSAETFTRRYNPLMVASGVISLLGGVGGLFAGYWLDIPASATIVLLLVAIYLGCVLTARLRRRGRPAPAARLRS